MKLPKQPRFTAPTTEPPKPVSCSGSDKIVKRMRNRQIDFMDHAMRCLNGVTEEEFEGIFSAVMSIYHQQAVFRIIAVSPPAPDGVCEITFHNDIPVLSNSRYMSSSMASYGHFRIENIRMNFPGMVATNKGVLFGEPTSELNINVLNVVDRARVPQGLLK